MASLRTFIAVELDRQIIDEVTRVENLLKESQADVKWLSASNAHITLKFLGQVQKERIEKITQVIKDSVSSFKPFRLAIGALGAFPTTNSPRVIWIGAVTENNALEKLAEAIENNLVSLHFPKEKRSFKSHITIGRLRSNRKRRDLPKLLQAVGIEKKEMLVETVTLFKSTLSPGGARYDRLFLARL